MAADRRLGRVPLLGMALLPALVAWMIAGMTGAVLTLLAGVAATLVLPSVPVSGHMRLAGARPVPPDRALRLRAHLTDLAAQAGLRQVPDLYHLSGGPNAFSVGGPDAAGIALSHGLVTLLPEQELRAVLAHEIAHLAAGDIRLMRFGEVMNRICNVVAMTGLVWILVRFLLDGVMIVPDWVCWVLALAPTGVSLLQRWFSRAREFAADARAAGLLGSPRPLAKALARIEMSRRFSPGLTAAEMAGFRTPVWLRTHPPTEERLRRLEDLL